MSNAQEKMREDMRKTCDNFPGAFSHCEYVGYNQERWRIFDVNHKLIAMGMSQESAWENAARVKPIEVQND